MADFYVIWDEKSELFYDGRYGCTVDTLRETLARFVSVENATKDIKAHRRQGTDVSTWRICGVNMLIDGSPITPDLGEIKSGFAIEIKHPGKPGFKCYWRGSKKAPKLDFSKLYYGPRSTATASIFSTRTAAEKVLELFKGELAAMLVHERQRIELDQRMSGPLGLTPYTGTYDIVSAAKLRVVKVGE